MKNHDHHREPLPPSWIERNTGTIVRGLVALCVGLVLFDIVFHFVGHKHVHFDAESIPGFYALAGFVSYVGLVLTAKQLRKILMRPNDYYGEAPVTESRSTRQAPRRRKAHDSQEEE